MDISDARMSKSELLAQLQQINAELERARAELRSRKDVSAVLHDLEVHQEEIKMQNEQLKAAQHALEQSSDRFAELYDFTPVIYITLDQNGSIQEINLTGAGLLGIERSAVIGRPMLVFVADEDRPLMLDHMRRCRHGAPDAAVTSELRVQTRRNGEKVVVPVQLTTRKLAGSKGPVFPTVVSDLTEQLKNETERRELRLREEAARAASEAKDRFLAMLSHELRTPLTPVLAAVTAIELDQGASTEIRNLVDVTRRNVELEAKLIDDLLDVTRISRGKLRLSAATVDLNSVVHDVMLLFGEECAAKNLRCDSDLKAEKHHVRGDPVRLRQVVWNLVKNAIKFTPPNGHVMIRTINDASGRLVLSVSDTGIGIEPADMSKIFAAFEQAPIRSGAISGGLGLGLFICKALIDAHGGRIHVFSPGKNQGSTFEIYLDTIDAPAAQPAQAPPRAAPDRDVGPRPSKSERTPLEILLVEDHPDTARMMAHLLQRHGHHVKLANTIKDAVSLASDDFDLVISDLGLPDGSGTELIRAIHKIQPIPGIALSGYGTDEDIRRSHEAGFSEHLVKPVNFPRLLAVIDRLGAIHSDAGQAQAS